mgnify:CR=1 FL=1
MDGVGRVSDYGKDLETYSDWVESKILTEGELRLYENALGLAGETGEVSEKIKKMIRDKTRFSSEDILKELGDVLFYTVAIANIYDGTLKSLIELNVDKLNSRTQRGTLKGSGDNR